MVCGHRPRWHLRPIDTALFYGLVMRSKALERRLSQGACIEQLRRRFFSFFLFFLYFFSSFFSLLAQGHARTQPDQGWLTLMLAASRCRHLTRLCRPLARTGACVGSTQCLLIRGGGGPGVAGRAWPLGGISDGAGPRRRLQRRSRKEQAGEECSPGPLIVRTHGASRKIPEAWMARSRNRGGGG
ncbi:hypothetical protein LX36DRAFT_435428 [Colletotrichum falcatum]|nr:hypothetical protein LX36DRAFT_435428 [Colletotrichum falcatum]